MLKSTFQHIKGIGKKSEHELWRSGVTSWTQYKQLFWKQLSIFDGEDPNDLLTKSMRAYESGDTAFFAEHLSPANYYRIALAYPDDTVFLDIETTGLSLYYDQVTLVGWSIGNEYGVYISGSDNQRLRPALKRAKVIVTFNGTMFDLKFLDKTFPELSIPPVHLDLRFFAKRVFLSGGQKAIEKEIGFVRENDLKDMQGESAPVLWHQYRRGDKAALRRLIEYNHADVEGMKAILDYSINKTYDIEEIPEVVRVKSPFSSRPSKIQWAARKPKNSNSNKIFVEEFKGQAKPLITYGDLIRKFPLEKVCVVGIDLVSSEDRESGYCILKGNHAETCRVKTDDEMIQLAKASDVDLVSIDSPLSIPEGRTSFFDDDPYREQFGIMRLCERILKKRGINVYPCLIPSMQKLTKRGMELADKFRKQGIAVIESYPGAAQDIMCIPRKQSGYQHLTDGMAEFGIVGGFENRPVSHDELDAITSAIVGLFYWTGMYEALGSETEDYLIIPDLNTDSNKWLSRKVIGISGEIAAGKTTIANYLEGKGYCETRYSAVLQELLEKEGKEANRGSLQEIGRIVNEEKGQRWLGNKVISKIHDNEKSVVDGVRFLEDAALLKEKFGPAFFHVHVEAAENIRRDRMRNKKNENLSLKKAMQSKTEQEISKLTDVANVIIENNSSLKSLHNKINKMLEEI
jgi:uncharacterized protein YprB with RNaseH-like and TPR domain/predicted nuclease with RNAse H fold/dephospho-CoA kinase